MQGINMITVDTAVEDLTDFVRSADIEILAQLYSQHCQGRNDDAAMIECEGEYSAPYKGGVRMRITVVPDTKSEPESITRVCGSSPLPAY